MIAEYFRFELWLAVMPDGCPRAGLDLETKTDAEWSLGRKREFERFEVPVQGIGHLADCYRLCVHHLVFREKLILPG